MWLLTAGHILMLLWVLPSSLGNIEDKVREWPSEVLFLARIAESHPHAAYSALTHGLSSRWHYVFWTQPDIVEFLQLSEDVIHCTLLPALSGILLLNDTIRNLVTVPPWWGGWGFSTQLCFVLRNSLLHVTSQGPYLATLTLGSHLIISTWRWSNFPRSLLSTFLNSLSIPIKVFQFSLSFGPILTNCLGSGHHQRGFCLVVCLPLSEYDFSLHRAAFHDAIAVHYGWPLCRAPSHYACGTTFSVDHALSCPKGGLSFLHHNKIRTLQLVS